MARKIRNFLKALDRNGDGTGLKFITQDYQSSPDSFEYRPGDNISHTEIYTINFIFYGGVTPLSTYLGGETTGPLNANTPIEIKLIEEDGYVNDFSDDFDISNNARLFHFTCGEFYHMDLSTGQDALVFTFDFKRITGAPLVMNPGDILQAYYQYNMEDQSRHFITIGGLEYFR